MTDTAQTYRMPPPDIVDLVDAPAAPEVRLDPGGNWMLVVDRPGLMPIAELARPELRLAGLRIDPATRGESRQAYGNRMRLKRLADGMERQIDGLPPEARLRHFAWAPDGSHVAFTVTTDEAIRLWVGAVESARAWPVETGRLNAVLGAAYCWAPDSRSLFCLTVPEERERPPAAPPAPAGPMVQENVDSTAPSRTYQDLLKNAHDADLFENYATAQVVRVGLQGDPVALGEPEMTLRVEPSPDGRFVLAEVLHRPFSYLVPCYRFPRRVEVRDREGHVIRQIADLPLAEEVPIAFDAVPVGPRAIAWRADAPATLVWAEAQDGGDPGVESAIRDRLLTLSAPFDADPAILTELALRYAGIHWGGPDLALIWERWWKTRRVRTWCMAPDAAATTPVPLWDRSWEDRYADPGTPLMRPTAAGTRVLLTDAAGRLFLAGEGASPEGDRPFLDRFDRQTGVTERLWRSAAPYYERPVRLLDPEDGVLVTCREAVNEPPNYFVRHLTTGDTRQLTAFPHPTPQLRSVSKELIQYTREDGVQLTATLYLPPGYAPEDGPPPMLLWAYPREFKSAAAAGQVNDSPHRFVRIPPGSPLYMLAAGYAVLDGPAMPIIGEGDREANDTYVTQLVSSAQAAVDEVVRRGVARRDRIAVGGHSYGAFMTANLLAHTRLFRAGIARSGAYNRTLTPFGFQAEERTLWQAPDVYAAMSPFMHADKIETPLLLLHGEADNNAGTFPIQSERLFNALKGHGATVRLVLLPHESHGYQARESVMHMLWEMTNWLDRYVR